VILEAVADGITAAPGNVHRFLAGADARQPASSEMADSAAIGDSCVLAWRPLRDARIPATSPGTPLGRSAMDIQLYDTTLRDGMQGEGMSLSADEKLRVAHRLDALGIDLIEAGFPASNPKELELFELLAREAFAHAEVAAFGMTRRRGTAAEADPALRVLADSFAPVCTLVGKTWTLHLEKVVRVDREENLRMIEESIAFLVAEGKRVLYDAEHFFDGYAADPDYALRCLRAAVDAGAETVVPCDTNGGTLPDTVRAIMEDVVAAVGDAAQVGIHCHDDAGCGVANSLAGVAAGASHVQGTMNGYGERCGNANLVTIIPNLQLKLGHRCLTDEQLAELTDAAYFLDELLNFTPNPDAPYVGRNAFAHKGGMHVAGVNEDPATFEHVAPELVGNRRELLVSELSGRGTVRARAEAAGLSIDDATVQRVIERVKELEHAGYHFEAADGSFELLLRKEAGDYEPLFRLESWRVIVEKRADGHVETEATIKIWLDGERYVRTAEGNGPVHALDRALRDAIGAIHPHLKDIELVNFKVRILDERKGTGAITRVLIDSSDHRDVWGSIGVDENIIAASWEALVDSIEYGMQPAPDRAARP
jgi:2-isopropylmalate synthase